MAIKETPPLHRWRISLINNTPAATLGCVKAPTLRARHQEGDKGTRTSSWLRGGIVDDWAVNPP
jgi:hypothetical protein